MIIYIIFILTVNKPGCTAIEDGCRFEILDLGSRGIVLSM